MSYRASPELLRFVKVKEGFSSKWYKQGSDPWTVGYGFTDEWPKFKPIAEPQASALLENLLSTRYYFPVQRAQQITGWDLPPESRDALVSFTYNFGGGWVGQENPGGSGYSMWQAFKSGNPDRVSVAFMLYDMPGTIFYNGLKARRAQERTWFLSGFKTPDPYKLLPTAEATAVRDLYARRGQAERAQKWTASNKAAANRDKVYILGKIRVLKAMNSQQLKTENRRQRLALLRDAIANRKLEV